MESRRGSSCPDHLQSHPHCPAQRSLAGNWLLSSSGPYQKNMLINNIGKIKVTGRHFFITCRNITAGARSEGTESGLKYKDIFIIIIGIFADDIKQGILDLITSLLLDRQ